MRGFSAVVLMMGIVFAGIGGAALPAVAADYDPVGLLNQGSSLLNERQEVESRLAVEQERMRALEQDRQQLNSQRSQYLESSQQYQQGVCGTTSSYVFQAQCNQDRSQLSSREAELRSRQEPDARQFRETSAEVERLNAKREELQRREELMNLQLQRLEFSGTTKECVDRLPKGDLQSQISAYEQCWDRTSTAGPRMKPERSTVPTLDSLDSDSKPKKRRRVIEKLPE